MTSTTSSPISAALRERLSPLVQANHYITGLEGGDDAFGGLIELARQVKADPERFYAARPLAGKVMGSLFVSPSVRTRTSFEAAMFRLGGHMVTLTPGQGVWGIAFEKGQVMSGAEAEHIIEAAGVLSSYCDVLGLRAFAAMQDFDAEMLDAPIQALAAHASKPVISLESAVYHPCQGLADAITMTERLGDPRGEVFTLSWAPHPRCCGTPVPHSALLSAARMGMKVRVAHPPGYDLHAPVLEQARALSAASGGDFTVTHDQDAALDGAHVVYGKAWGSRADYGQAHLSGERNMRHADWQITAAKMAKTADAGFMHCLPVRRNVVVSDDVLDSAASMVQEQAANRLWGQTALLLAMLT